MGRDKALLEFRGQPLVEIAVEKLRSFCATVSIVGERPDLQWFAPVVTGERKDCGPGAGVEAGLRACRQPWALFMPVDVPLVPAEFLARWVEEALRVRMTVSYLAAWRKQPAFCLLQKERARALSERLELGVRELELLLNGTAEADCCASWIYDPYDLYGYPEYLGPDDKTLETWFTNVNTPSDLRGAEEQ